MSQSSKRPRGVYFFRSSALKQSSSSAMDEAINNNSSRCPLDMSSDINHTLRILEELVIEDDCINEKLAASTSSGRQSATSTRTTFLKDGDDTAPSSERESQRNKAAAPQVLPGVGIDTASGSEGNNSNGGGNRTNKLARSVTCSLPGAHRVKGSNQLEDSVSNHHDLSYYGSNRSSPDRVPIKEETCHLRLAVADPVEEESTEDLPQAEGIEPNKKGGQRRCCKAFMIALSCLSISCGILIVAMNVNPGSHDAELDAGHPPLADGTYMAEDPPTLDWDMHALSLLPDDTIFSLQDKDSPQARAFDWLLEDINQNPLFPDHQIIQRYALATIYFATGGEHWLANDNWLSHTQHECNWYYQQDYKMKCTLWNSYQGDLGHFFPQFAPGTERCSDDGHYQNLWLDTNNLVGSIPNELYMLTTLKTVSLVNNKLVGSLQGSIGKLTNLEGFFSLGMKQGGTIPSEIGLLTNLRGLGLLSNEHTGQIPSELWSLTSLETVALGGNSLQGTLPPDIGSLPNLKWFCVFHGQLSGTIPTEVGQLSHLEMFDMEGNDLAGPIPSEVGLLSKMAMLSLLDSSLTGTIPTEICGMKLATLLNLGMNSLTGTIPTQIGSMINLEYLDVSENQDLVNIIPTQIELLPNLKTFNS